MSLIPNVTISFLIFTIILVNAGTVEKESLRLISHLQIFLESNSLNLSISFSNPEIVPLIPSFAKITKPVILLFLHSFFINS